MDINFRRGVALYSGPGDPVPGAHFRCGGGGRSHCYRYGNTMYKFTEYYYANTLEFMFQSSTGKSENILTIRALTNQLYSHKNSNFV